jgi:3-oxoacyl-[acyl-carrier protein] reductase
MSFEGKTAIVTGATRGIGRAIALELARRGCHVAFNYAVSHDLARMVASDIESLGSRALAFNVNVQDAGGVKEMVRRVKESFGGIDYLINNAGSLRDRALYLQTEEDWSEVIGTNLTGVFNFTRAVIADMMKRESGRIICLTSVSALRGVAGQTNYSAAKAGVIGLVHSLAREVAPFGITVNAIAPGLIRTDMTETLMDQKKKAMLSLIPMKRLGLPEEVADLACFLLSDRARYITGQVIAVDGGASL